LNISSIGGGGSGAAAAAAVTVGVVTSISLNNGGSNLMHHQPWFLFLLMEVLGHLLRSNLLQWQLLQL
jgi:hypothetical protein